MMGRALAASGAATLVDGASYNGVLTLAAGHYAWAALCGAGFGAVTNFVLSRHWVFPPTDKRGHVQLAQYALGSALTYVVLQASLWLLIERFGVNERLAWFPCKVIAWLCVSYPFSRWIVFARSS